MRIGCPDLAQFGHRQLRGKFIVNIAHHGDGIQRNGELDVFHAVGFALANVVGLLSGTWDGFGRIVYWGFTLAEPIKAVESTFSRDVDVKVALPRYGAGDRCDGARARDFDRFSVFTAAPGDGDQAEGGEARHNCLAWPHACSCEDSSVVGLLSLW